MPRHSDWFRNLVRLRGDALAVTGLFSLTLLIFLLAPVRQVTDSSYSMLLSESLLHHRSPALDHYALPPGNPVWYGYYFKYDNIYQLEVVNGHVYYHLPPGTPLLSLPFVAALNSFGVSAANPDGTYNPKGELIIESVLAAILMAGLTCIFFLMARLALSTGWSVVVAVGGALGSQIFSTASRALWTETWGALLLGIVLLMLVRATAGRASLKPVLLATLLAWMYFVRPTFAVHIIAITVYVFLFYRGAGLRYAMTGAVWLGAFMLYSWHIYGHLLPNYYRASRLQFDIFWTALAGHLFSPGRGLLVYVPVLFFIAYSLVRYRRQIVFPRLVLLALLVVVAHLTIISAFLHWWGGHTFGPRFTTGLVPWFVLLAILGVQAMRNARTQNPGPRVRHRLELGAGASLLVVSVMINGLGAASQPTWLWNVRPVNIDEHPERNWDWRQPQFLAGLLHPPLPDNVPAATPGRVDFASPQSAGYCWYGWSPAETQFRWTEATEAALVFRVNGIQDLVLTAKLHALVIPNQHPAQRLSIRFNREPVADFSFNDTLPREISVVLPSNLMRQQNLLEFFLPDAISPASLGVGEDSRPLGIAVYWIQFQPKPIGHLPGNNQSSEAIVHFDLPLAQAPEVENPGVK